MIVHAERRSVLALLAGRVSGFTPPWVHAQALDTIAIKRQ